MDGIVSLEAVHVAYSRCEMSLLVPLMLIPCFLGFKKLV